MNKGFHGRLGEARLGFNSVLCHFTKRCIKEDHRGLVTTSRAFRQYEPGFFKSFTYITKVFKTLVILLERLHMYEKRYTLFSFFFFQKRQNVFIYRQFYLMLAILTNYKFSISVQCVFGTSESTSVVSVQGQSDASLCLRFPKLIWRLQLQPLVV